MTELIQFCQGAAFDRFLGFYAQCRAVTESLAVRLGLGCKVLFDCTAVALAMMSRVGAVI